MADASSTTSHHAADDLIIEYMDRNLLHRPSTAISCSFSETANTFDSTESFENGVNDANRCQKSALTEEEELFLFLLERALAPFGTTQAITLRSMT